MNCCIHFLAIYLIVSSYSSGLIVKQFESSGSWWIYTLTIPDSELLVDLHLREILTFLLYTFTFFFMMLPLSSLA
jgi:hypothetical protein